jgi:hypothetical protein
MRTRTGEWWSLQPRSVKGLAGTAAACVAYFVVGVAVVIGMGSPDAQSRDWDGRGVLVIGFNKITKTAQCELDAASAEVRVVVPQGHPSRVTPGPRAVWGSGEPTSVTCRDARIYTGVPAYLLSAVNWALVMAIVLGLLAIPFERRGMRAREKEA